MHGLNLLAALFLASATAGPSKHTGPDSQKLTAFDSELLQAHNAYRREVGEPPLRWSDSLAAGAKAWARHLAEKREFQHSKAPGLGENIWMGSSGGYTAAQMVKSWGDEKRYFISGKPFPDVSSSGNWRDVGHYTQMIWRNTKQVGCGLAHNAANDYLVCRYSPPGNIVSEPVK